MLETSGNEGADDGNDAAEDGNDAAAAREEDVMVVGGDGRLAGTKAGADVLYDDDEDDDDDDVDVDGSCDDDRDGNCGNCGDDRDGNCDDDRGGDGGGNCGIRFCCC